MRSDWVNKRRDMDACARAKKKSTRPGVARCLAGTLGFCRVLGDKQAVRRYDSRLPVTA